MFKLAVIFLCNALVHNGSEKRRDFLYQFQSIISTHIFRVKAGNRKFYLLFNVLFLIELAGVFTFFFKYGLENSRLLLYFLYGK